MGTKIYRISRIKGWVPAGELSKAAGTPGTRPRNAAPPGWKSGPTRGSENFAGTGVAPPPRDPDGGGKREKRGFYTLVLYAGTSNLSTVNG